MKKIGIETSMTKYVLFNSIVLFIGLLLIIFMRDDGTVLGGFIQLIGLSLTIISGFLLILSFFGLTLSRLP
ncbi:MAG: hypothetical protein JW840_10135 [Candidatus Thermoplasmatota archaeon]|nr:hypothetical protein [Candidatus Thermoplasmatota archaeon]